MHKVLLGFLTNATKLITEFSWVAVRNLLYISRDFCEVFIFLNFMSEGENVKINTYESNVLQQSCIKGHVIAATLN